MADIFLSYARSDTAAAERIARELGKHGWSVWFDREIPAHETFADVIATELGKARAVLVLWSDAAVESQWVRSEANRARELRKLVQARLGAPRLPMPFDQIQCADLGGRGTRSSRGWSQVLESLGVLLAQGADESRPGRVPSPISRRSLLIGTGAAAVIGSAGFAAWRLLEPPTVSPQAQLLIDRGLAALQDNDALDPQGPGSTRQAIALLTDATNAAPNSPIAWGGLAMAYAVRKRVAPLAERPGLDARSRSAASRALKLDPNELRALGALRLIDPVYRRWLSAEKADAKALKKNPNLPILLFVMADLLGSVGRWKDAAAFSRQFDRRKFLIPGADRKVFIDLWCSGDLQGADSALATAVDRWPQHPQVWQSRVAYLMFSGRPDEAWGLLSSGAERPLEVTQEYVDAARDTAGALAGRIPRSTALAKNRGFLGGNPAQALHVAQACAALGSAEDAFSILEGYYFGQGKWASVAPEAGDEDRITNRLFQPPMASLWGARPFAALLNRIGLEDYWRQSGTVPDFRRR